MSGFQPISYNGEVVALVVGGQAIVPKALPEPDRQTVKAMCLYALEVAAGARPGPYTDEHALDYARQAVQAGG